MASGIRLWAGLTVLGVLSAAGMAGAAPAARQNVTPDGAIYTFGSGPSGEAVLTIDQGSLHVEKSVAADGSSTIAIRGNGDEVRVEVSADRVAVSGSEGRASYVPGANDRQGEQAVRVALARSGAVQRFRAFAAQVSARGRRTAFDLAVALSGAVVGQLAGDPDALRQFSRQHQAPEGKLRQVGRRVIVDCWGQYEAFISWAWTQYLYCLTDTSRPLIISSYSYCEIQYTMRAESAWFQFLSCSAINVV